MDGIQLNASHAANPKAEPFVELDRVSMVYRKGWRGATSLALDQVSLTIYRGETVGFIGNNGAGKSTTLRIILGLQRPTHGLACLNGLPVDDPEARRGVAYVPENPYLYDYLTPMELLAIGIKMHSRQPPVGAKAIDEHCMYWLERFGIAQVAGQRIRTFSKGMTQRTALAHALACQPDFLILDEPLSGLDPIGRLEVVAILDEYRASGRTLLFSSHVLNDVERLADRFNFIHYGRIRAVCTVNEILSSDEARFAVVVEGKNGPEGFVPVSSRLWRREVTERDLRDLLAMIEAAREESGITLHSVRNVNSLERAYTKFVQNANH